MAFGSLLAFGVESIPRQMDPIETLDLKLEGQVQGSLVTNILTRDKELMGTNAMSTGLRGV
jgi:hypothetical protein